LNLPRYFSEKSELRSGRTETALVVVALLQVINSLPNRVIAVRNPSESAGLARFGAFKVDFRAGELLKNGRRIRLQDQPLRVLAMLLEKPGEVVTREEVRKRLWPEDTFVDFDRGLSNAINRREALNDSADVPNSCAAPNTDIAIASTATTAALLIELTSINSFLGIIC
jgi:hypothetical protein